MGIRPKMFLLFFVCVLHSLHAYKDLRVEGNYRISDEAIRGKLEVEEGDILTKEDINLFVKNLYATNLFAQIRVSYDNEVLSIWVKELPSVNSVTFDGNSAVDVGILEKDLGIEERQILSKDQLRKSLLRVSTIYRQMGYFKSRIEVDVIYLSQNRVDVIFKISEGPAAKVSDVVFFGNENFSDFSLKSVVSSKAFYWWRLLKSDSLFNPEAAQNDADALQRYYHDRGYLDFKVLSMTAQLSLFLESFSLLYHVSEGEPYIVRDFALEHNIDGVPAPEEVEYALKKKKYYRRAYVQEDVDTLEKWFSEKGYPYVRVRPDAHKHSKDKEVTVSYVSYIIPRITVRSVSIEGNRRTYNRVLYPLLQVWEGDVLDDRYIEASRAALEHTGFFESVSFEKTPSLAEPNAVDVRFIVKERPTGSLGLRLSYSGTIGARAEAFFDEPNFWGHGYLLRINGSVGSRIWDGSVTFSDPAFLGRNLLVGTTIRISGKTTRDVSKVQSQDAYSVYSKGWRVFMGIPIRQYWSVRPSYEIATERFETKYSRIYSIKRNQFRNVFTKALAETYGYKSWPKGSVLISKASIGLAYDKRDRRFDATKGLYAFLNLEVAGLGGDVKTWQLSLDLDYHHKLTDDFTLRAYGFASMIRPWSDRYSLRVCDRYRLGGPYSLRGFREWGVGPKLLAFDEPIGGDTSVGGSLELLFPIGLPKESRFRGFLFMDAGTTWDQNGNLPAGFSNSKKLRISFGVGLRWASPMGVLSVSYGIPLNTADDDDEERVNLGMKSMTAAKDDFI